MGTVLGIVIIALTYFQLINLTWEVSIIFTIILVFIDSVSNRTYNNILSLAYASDNKIDSLEETKIADLQERVINLEEEIDDLKDKIESLDEYEN